MFFIYLSFLHTSNLESSLEINMKLISLCSRLDTFHSSEIDHGREQCSDKSRRCHCPQLKHHRNLIPTKFTEWSLFHQEVGTELYWCRLKSLIESKYNLLKGWDTTVCKSLSYFLISWSKVISCLAITYISKLKLVISLIKN